MHSPTDPIGLTPALVLSHDAEARTFELKGIDLVKGTPILAMQPYIYDKHCERHTFPSTRRYAAAHADHDMSSLRNALLLFRH